jgi:hypothetical protein
MSNNVTQELQATAFGELSVAEPTPISQMAANYGIPSKSITFAFGTASVTAEDSLFIVDSGAAADQVGTVLTKRHMQYRPGQGAMARFTALYDVPATGNLQLAGFITATDSYAFGYEDTTFGIMHEHDGVTEIQELLVTTPAGGSENATVTIDGSGYTVPLTVGTVQHNAFEISTSLNTQVEGYVFSSNNDQVIASAIDALPQGSFAFTSATAIAAWTQGAAGALPVRDFIPQSTWNADTFTDLDQTKGNVFQIKMQYLGFGAIDFSIENPETGKFELAHRIEYSNQNTLPSIRNPTLRAGWLSRNTTNNTSVVIKGASVGIFNEGDLRVTEDPRGSSNSQLSVGLAQTNILTIRNRSVFGNIRNRAEAIPLSISAFTSGTKGAILELRKNATITGDLDYQYIDKDNSISEIAFDAGTVSDGELLSAVSVGSASFPIDLTDFGIRLFPNETLTISMAVTQTPAADMTAAIVGVEDL